MALIKIPIRSDLPAFNERIELEGVIYNLDIRYNERMDRWAMDILTEEEIPIVSGLLLLTNVPLLDQLTVADLPPGDFIMLDRANLQRDASADNLGEDINLFYQESEDLV